MAVVVVVVVAGSKDITVFVVQRLQTEENLQPEGTMTTSYFSSNGAILLLFHTIMFTVRFFFWNAFKS